MNEMIGICMVQNIDWRRKESGVKSGRKSSRLNAERNAMVSSIGM